MSGGDVERGFRDIPGVVSVAVGPAGAVLLAAEDADVRALRRSAEAFAAEHGVGPVSVLSMGRPRGSRLAALRAFPIAPRAVAASVAAVSIAVLAPLIPMRVDVDELNLSPAPERLPVREVAAPSRAGGPGSPGSPAPARPAEDAAGDAGLRLAPPPATRRPATRAPRVGPAPVVPGPVTQPPRPDPAPEPSCRHDQGLHRGWTDARGRAHAWGRPDCVPAAGSGGRHR